MEVTVRQSPGSSLACFVFACSVAVAYAGAAAGGQHGGGHDGGGHHGQDGGHDPGSQNDDGHNGGPPKGPGGDPGDPSSDPPSAPPSEGDGISTITMGTVSPTTAAKAATVAPSSDGGQSLDLPPALQPSEDIAIPPAVYPIEALPGVPDNVVRACHDAIEQAAAQFGATSVRVSSAGPLNRLGPDTISAPVQVSIDYAHQGSGETRQAQVGCELNAKGSVIGLT
ncbi:hypothetical protein EJ070_22910 [Mesorhizobium sp. M1E.F.Ca.ET.045.02.1.1]|nr:hypothetical protein EJ070_22910 [Mesorhizobium sp. M1E.F.Ca.ET.045.02.1.1]RUW70861.1 hypothetical protein EOA29_35375 [Mesorhizobium sp. M1E.F.Ca.ET.063.01.1.1]RWD85017.1 MAG: hypothetical protein EOS38_22600 [Mesorhizobium sp.]